MWTHFELIKCMTYLLPILPIVLQEGHYEGVWNLRVTVLLLGEFSVIQKLEDFGTLIEKGR